MSETYSPCPEKPTVGDLLKALKPRGEVHAWVRIMQSNDTWFDYSLRLHKTELVGILGNLSRVTPTVPFYAVDWTTPPRPPVSYYESHSRIVRIGKRTPATPDGVDVNE